MTGPWFAKRFPRRLAAGAARFAAMAWNPSTRAPYPAELLRPQPFETPRLPTLPPEERALLDRVLADPNADEPRLQFAAWCDRHGDPRGPFIRAQLDEFHRGGEALSATEGSWDAATQILLRRLAPWSARDVVFRRGFAEGMSLAGRAFISLGASLFQITPLRDVRLVAVAPYLAELARTDHLGKLEGLDLSGNWIGPAGVRELIASPHWAGLQRLNLARNGLGAEGVRALLAGPGSLRALFVAGNALTADDIAALLTHPALAPLDTLDVSENPLGPQVVEVLQVSGFLARGVRLVMESVQLGPTGAQTLARSGGRLRALDLGFNDITDAGVVSLVAAPWINELTELVLRGNRITDTGAHALVQAPGLARLRHLDLSANFIGSAGEKKLRDRFGSSLLLR